MPQDSHEIMVKMIMGAMSKSPRNWTYILVFFFFLGKYNIGIDV